jgi:hypothetical protein
MLKILQISTFSSERKWHHVESKKSHPLFESSLVLKECAGQSSVLFLNAENTKNQYSSDIAVKN